MLLKLSFCMFIFCKALIAQSVEHGANNARVAGSKPAESIFYTHYITHITEGNKIKQKREEKEKRGKGKGKGETIMCHFVSMTNLFILSFTKSNQFN